MPSIEGIPHLELVRPDRIRFHENPEGSRTARLVARLREEGRLRNPPIVARLDETEYVLLDGANRVSALRDIGYSHLPVQVIDYERESVQLKGWHHLLVEGAKLNLREAYAGIDGVRLQEVREADLPGLLELRRVYAALVDVSGTPWALFPESGRVLLPEWMSVITQAVAAYEGRTRLERIKVADYAELPEVFHTVDHQLALYPTITKVDLLRLVSDGITIPTGLTRHLIAGRALGLNLDLAFLTELETDEQKKDHLRRFVDDLEMRGRIRFYEESAFIMNE
ncbi:MAG: ParB N-terminal domain-containing protein [Gemmatimonadetes bacterium]|nr:ParB N-terminal domain-containing protein [Gemmatimonadota bacterium]